MIDRKALLDDLKRQVKAVETDLGKQVRALPDVRERLDGEYRQARKLGRTAATWNSWLDERITQVAAAWVLGSVFVRFCEDNLLIPEPYLTGSDNERSELARERYAAYVADDPDPTYRGWLECAFGDLGSGQAGSLLFNPNHNPLYQIPLSHEGAGELVEFWRAHAGVHDFTDPSWDTRFLGDLYQDLSEAARKTYALLQTPEFVEEFILDRTMDPVIRELGPHFGELKMIDPTCGSGHFVLGAFRRMVKLWEDKQPHADRYERVRAALESVHGVDINPFAVAIARFRLLVAAMAATGIQTLRHAADYEWPINLAVGDSLIKARQIAMTFEDPEPGDPLAEFTYATEDIHEFPRILEQGRYDVVVGNPPYITVKDKVLNALYRKLYPSCSGTYALSVPFAERFFQLAKTGSANGLQFGMVGQITASSFTKREFGRRLIEEYFAHKVELSEVVDTSGAYIPGHGTPTVILVGRKRSGIGRSDTVRTVRGVQGEPSVPQIGAKGLVWQAIVKQINEPQSSSNWVSVDDLNRERFFGNHPWILADGGRETIEAMDRSSTEILRGNSTRVGFVGMTHADDVMVRPTHTWSPTLKEFIKRAAAGDEVRDWVTESSNSAFFPYDTSNTANHIPASVLNSQDIWPYRTELGNRATFSGLNYFQSGKSWWEWHQLPKDTKTHPWCIAYAFVATHNHFTVDRVGTAFKQSAPVVKFDTETPRDRIVQIMCVLNSSTAGFWLKMHCHNMGSTVDTQGARQSTVPFEDFYQFNGINVAEFPLPSSYPTVLAVELDTLAQELAATSPTALTSGGAPSLAILHGARTKWEWARTRMIALQEELDWQVYSIYNLHAEDLRAPKGEVPDLALGERAFEIVLARKVAAGEASPEWFKRHNSTPITSIPDHWSDAYKAVVQKRIDAITNSRAIGMIERPEYKRRWATEGWDVLQERALRSWLLDRIENRDHWYQDEQPTLLTRAQLTDALSRDEDFMSVAGIYDPHNDLPTVVTALLTDGHVPFLAALRYKPASLKKRADWEHVWDLQRQEDAAEDEPTKRKIRDSIPVPPKYTSADFLRPSYWRARGKLDVPKERFISYATTNVGTPDFYGWAGWDHREQAQALTTYFTNNTTTKDELTAFLAGLMELQPWLAQWHGEFDPVYGMSPAAFFAGYRSQIQGENGLTDEDLLAWRPTIATRGRRAAKKKTDE